MGEGAQIVALGPLNWLSYDKLNFLSIPALAELGEVLLNFRPDRLIEYLGVNRGR